MRDDRAKPSGAAGRSRVGVNAKLQGAFGAVAVLTVIAAAVAIFSFSATEHGFERVSGHEVPVMTDALRLSAVSGEISAAAARFVNTKTAAEQAPISDTLELRKRQLTVLLEQLQASRRASPSFAAVETTSRRLDDNLTELKSAISDRSILRGRLETQLAQVHRIHTDISTKLTPIVDDSYFDVVTTVEDMGKSAKATPKDSAVTQITELRNALEIAAQTHLVTSLMSEAATAKEAAELVPIQDRFRSAASLLARATGALKNEDLRKTVAELVAFGQGEGSLFELRRQELAASARADRTIEDNVAIQRALDKAVTELVAEAETSMKQGAAGLVESLGFTRGILLMVAMASVLAAGCISVFYVRRGLVRRLTSIGTAMQRLSAGDVELDVPAVADRDELGEMARSLEVFRASEIERRGFAARQDEEQAAQRERAAAIERMIVQFRATVTSVIAAVTDNVSRMETTARTLSGIAGEADNQARAASVSSETASSNVRGVAGAAEELGASIAEISQQAAQANAVVERASAIAHGANQQIGQLTDGANRIGDVVKLIRAIADQTNLLALNATIEAARAGEAGRGFAVVASEVKTLASQTAKATEEIAAHIGAIQSATADAVDAIRSIGEVMGDISSFTVSIAAAVEEQSASTRTIADSVQQAASGASELAGNMATVTEAIEETNRAASAVLDATGALNVQSGTLQTAVDDFLTRVAAA
ncbi:MAG TPA: methyl-accepting chemotaxis protein [Xanthobacteraceae bacterium]|jgi:methyl-accepting chemotaxis protein|nr:methyl-accepting chemotaxis protein [Xanthobacteraceae bacterium]